MFSVALCLVALAALKPEFVLAQDPPAAPAAQATFPAVPLAQKRIPHNAIPYQVDTDPTLIRGSQFGYNQCNSTTGGQESRCQTSYVNDFDDFCLWGPPEKDMNVGDHEGEMVAWCTKPGHGTRLIPGGALTGVQFIRTEAYVQVVGFIDQTAINILKGDWGGEMDPHGADLRGNPLGGLIYSNAWTANDQTYDQVIEWHNFIGGNFFCLKVCDQSNPAAANYCEHIFDRIGCKYNIPNNAQDGTFEHCDGDLQDFPGTYTTNGQVMTYTQPHGPIETIPYEPRVPASSNCVSYTSSQVYAALATVTPSGGAVVSPAPTNGPNASAGVAGNASGASGRPTSGSPTGTAANSTPSSAASVVAVSTGLSLMGVVFSALFLA